MQSAPHQRIVYRVHDPSLCPSPFAPHLLHNPGWHYSLASPDDRVHCKLAINHQSRLNRASADGILEWLAPSEQYNCSGRKISATRIRRSSSRYKPAFATARHSLSLAIYLGAVDGGFVHVTISLRDARLRKNSQQRVVFGLCQVRASGLVGFCRLESSLSRASVYFSNHDD